MIASMASVDLEAIATVAAAIAVVLVAIAALAVAVWSYLGVRRAVHELDRAGAMLAAWIHEHEAGEHGKPE
jgi:hypothetical protein